MRESRQALSPAPDEEVLRLLQSRDPDGLRRLFDEHGPRVHGGLRREFGHLLDDAHIEEALSLAVHRAWRSAATFDLARGTLRSWFYVIARNCALRVLERERRERRYVLVNDWDWATHEAQAPAPPPEPARARSHAAFLATLRRCIDRLTATQRAIIEADLEAGGIADTAPLARRLETSINAVYAQRAMARRALRIALVRRGYFREFADEATSDEGEAGPRQTTLS